MFTYSFTDEATWPLIVYLSTKINPNTVITISCSIRSTSRSRTESPWQQNSRGNPDKSGSTTSQLTHAGATNWNRVNGFRHSTRVVLYLFHGHIVFRAATWIGRYCMEGSGATGWNTTTPGRGLRCSQPPLWGLITQMYLSIYLDTTMKMLPCLLLSSDP
jgi:hypothetical protein